MQSYDNQVINTLADFSRGFALFENFLDWGVRVLTYIEYGRFPSKHPRAPNLPLEPEELP